MEVTGYVKLNLIKAGYKGEFNSDSITNEIPATIRNVKGKYYFSIDRLDNGYYCAGYWDNVKEKHLYTNMAKTLFEAFSKTWLELKEDGFIK